MKKLISLILSSSLILSLITVHTVVASPTTADGVSLITQQGEYPSSAILYESFDSGIGGFSKDKYVSTSNVTGKFGNALCVSDFYKYYTIRRNAILHANQTYRISYWIKGVKNYTDTQSCIIVAKNDTHTNSLGNTTAVTIKNYEYAGIGTPLTDDWQYIEGYVQNTTSALTDEAGNTIIYPMIYKTGGYGDSYTVGSYLNRVSFAIDELKIEPVSIIPHGDMSSGLSSYRFSSNVQAKIVSENGNNVLAMSGANPSNINDLRTLVNVCEGETYTLSFRAKTATGTNSLKPIFVRENTSLEGTPTTKYQYLTGMNIDTTYKTYSCTFTAPTETSTTCAYRYPDLYIRALSSGVVYFDDLRIERVDPNINTIRLSGKCEAGENVSVTFAGIDATQYSWRVMDSYRYTTISGGDTTTKQFTFSVPSTNAFTLGIKAKKSDGTYTDEVRTDVVVNTASSQPTMVSEPLSIGISFPDTVWAPDFPELRAMVNVQNSNSDLYGFVAVYDEAGVLKSASCSPITDGKNIISSSTVDGTNATVMILDDVLRPMRISRSIKKDTTSTFVYVSKAGKRLYQGTYAKPFDSIATARTRKLGTLSGNVYVMLHADTYNLTAPLEFTNTDSGNNGTITYASYGGEAGERATLSGGVSVTGWSVYDSTKNIYRATVDSTVTNFRQLYVNGVRATRAKNSIAPGVLSKTDTGYVLSDNSILNLANPTDAEFVYYYKWTNPRCGITGITDNGDGTSTVTLNTNCYNLFKNKSHLEPDAPSFVENAYEYLDEPGEWYFDKQNHYLYYMPRAFEDISTAEVIVPNIEQLISASGTLTDPISNITFNNIEFSHANWLYPDTYGYSDAQSGRIRDGRDNVPTGAIDVKHAKNFNFEDCSFNRLGMTAITELWNVTNSHITGCEFYSLAGSGIYAGMPYKYDESIAYASTMCRNLDISNNYFHDVALDYNSCVPIATLSTHNTTVEHNEIFDVPYSGIHGGYGYTRDMTGLSYSYNYIHRVLNGNISDGGSIYFTGPTGGTVSNPNIVSNNYIAEQLNDYGAIYPDNSSNGWLINNNVLDLTKSFGYKSGKVRWLHSNAAYGNYADNNYTTNDYSTLSTTYLTDPDNDPGVTITNLHLVSDALWNEEARGIINTAGVDVDHAMRSISPYQITKSVDTTVNLKRGTSRTLCLYGEGGKYGVMPSANIVDICADDSGVVSCNGATITATAVGTTNITVYTLTDNCLKQTKISVNVY